MEGVVLMKEWWDRRCDRGMVAMVVVEEEFKGGMGTLAKQWWGCGGGMVMVVKEWWE